MSLQTWSIYTCPLPRGPYGPIALPACPVLAALVDLTCSQWPATPLSGQISRPSLPVSGSVSSKTGLPNSRRRRVAVWKLTALPPQPLGVHPEPKRFLNDLRKAFVGECGSHLHISTQVIRYMGGESSLPLYICGCRHYSIGRPLLVYFRSVSGGDGIEGFQVNSFKFRRDSLLWNLAQLPACRVQAVP